MGKKFLIDTCVIVKFLGGDFPDATLNKLEEILNDHFSISFITKIELLSFVSPHPEDIQIRRRFLEMAELLMVNHTIIDSCILIRQQTKVKLPDTLIAATAISHNLTLLSDNDKDFLKVVPLGLSYLNPRQV